MTNSPRVLLVDDDPFALETLSGALEASGIGAVGVSDPAEAIGKLESGRFDLLITDIVMDPIDGFELLESARRLRPELAAIVVTGHPSLEGSVTAMRRGASDYLAKPFHVEELIGSVREALGQTSGSHTSSPRGALSVAEHVLAGASRPAADLRERVARVASSDCPVALRGSEGSGRELVARSIHASSRRARRPIIAVDCESCADPGSLARRLGDAGGGTAYLECVDRLGEEARRRLLGMLRRGTPLDLQSTSSVDVRVISTTSRPTLALVEEGLLDRGLAGELGVVTIDVPSLSDRPGDIPELARRFAVTIASQIGTPVPRFEQGVVESLARAQRARTYRQLALSVERAVILAGDGPVALSGFDLCFGDADSNERPDLSIRLDSFELASVERRVVALALDRMSWNIKRAAESLGITRATLYSKIKRYALRDTVEAS